jgi:hypothetical protein
MPVSRRVVAAACGLLAITACARHRPTSPQELFAYRVQEYTEMRQQAEQRVGTPEVTTRPAALDARTTALAEAIREFRKNFKPGVVFSGDVGREFRRILATRLSAPDGPALISALESVMPHGYRPVINGTYPDGEPVTSMPPSLLEALPRLAPVLAYRIVGRDLLLIDRDTRLIVDILPEALPAST